MGLAAISDRLANLLVPRVRAGMRRVRFVTAIAVGGWPARPGLTRSLLMECPRR
jgi:hypothetical protein